MTNGDFDQRYQEFLDKFDDLFEAEENYLRWANEIQEDLPTSNSMEKALELHRRRQDERTNNLVRMALKEFLLKD